MDQIFRSVATTHTMARRGGAPRTNAVSAREYDDFLTCMEEGIGQGSYTGKSILTETRFARHANNIALKRMYAAADAAAPDGWPALNTPYGKGYPARLTNKVPSGARYYKLWRQMWTTTTGSDAVRTAAAAAWRQHAQPAVRCAHGRLRLQRCIFLEKHSHFGERLATLLGENKNSERGKAAARGGGMGFGAPAVAAAKRRLGEEDEEEDGDDEDSGDGDGGSGDDGGGGDGGGGNGDDGGGGGGGGAAAPIHKKARKETPTPAVEMRANVSISCGGTVSRSEYNLRCAHVWIWRRVRAHTWTFTGVAFARWCAYRGSRLIKSSSRTNESFVILYVRRKRKADRSSATSSTYCRPWARTRRAASRRANSSSSLLQLHGE